MDIIPEPDWDNLVTALMMKKGAAMILGATDSGKSCLSKYLIGELLERGVKVSLIDADIGQSALGLPGTVCMKTFSNKKDFEEFRFDRMSYVGSVNPATRMWAVIEAAERFAGLCRRKSGVVLVDTGGLIAGRVGRAFKLRKIRAVRPDHLIAMQRHNEQEGILKTAGENVEIHRISISKMARVRSRSERAAYRQEKLCSYFNQGILRSFSLNTKRIIAYYAEGLAELGGDFFEKGTVIGLNRGMDTAALGILSGVSGHSVRVRSPIKGVGSINRIIFGDIVAGAIREPHLRVRIP